MNTESKEYKNAIQQLHFFFLKTSGSFTSAMISAILRADGLNRAKLSQVYPELVDVVRRYQEEPGFAKEHEINYNESDG